MSKDYILTLEAIDRRLYSKDKSAPLARYSASGLDAPVNNHTPQGLSEECLNYMTEILTKHDRPNLQIDYFFFLHFGGWDALMDYIRADGKRRNFLLRCEEKGYSVASDRALFDRALIEGDPDRGPAGPSVSMKCILEANILIVSRYCGIYSGNTKKDLRDEIEGFLRNDPGEEKKLVPPMDPADRYAIFRFIRSQLEIFDRLTAAAATGQGAAGHHDQGAAPVGGSSSSVSKKAGSPIPGSVSGNTVSPEAEADCALGTALAWLFLAALLRDSCSCLCSLLPQNIQILQVEEREALRTDLPAVAPVSRPPRTGRIFKGRHRELAWIGAEFRHSRSPVWISGDGGSGKTALALRYASTCTDAICIYAPFHDDLVLTIADIRFQDRLTCEEISPEDLFAFNLSRITRYGVRLLLIIDNFDAAHYDRTFVEMLADVCESDPEGRTNGEILDLVCRTGADLLVTTRLRVPPQYPSVCLSDEDHLLTRAELVDLAMEIDDGHIWTEDEEVMMEEIILAVGKHVMAVELIAAALKYNAGFSTVAEVLEKVRGGRYAQIHDGGSSADLYTRLRRLFNFSIFPADQQAFLRILSLLPAGGIDRSLFMDLCGDIFQPGTLRDMLLRLRDLHLISVGSTISMHPVTADVAVDSLRPDSGNCAAFFHKVLHFYEPCTDEKYDYRRLAQVSRILMRCVDRLEFKEEPFSAGRRDLENKQNPAGEPDPAGGQNPFDQQGLRLRTLLQISRMEYETGHPQAALHWARAAEQTAKDCGMEEKAAAIQSEVYKALAQAESTVGLYDDAIMHYTQAIALLEKTKHDGRPEISITYNDLAVVCYEAMEYDLARHYLDTALQIQQEAYGEDSLELSTTYNNLGLVCSAREDHEQAIAFYEKSLALQLDCYGELHPGTAVTCCNIGQEYNDMGELEKAGDYLTRALRINTDLFGEDYVGNAGICNNLGLLYDNLSRLAMEDASSLLDTAFRWFWRSLSIMEKNFGPLHPHTADLYMNMADAYLAHGDRDNGLRCCETALAILQDLFGADHPRTQYTQAACEAIRLEK